MKNEPEKWEVQTWLVPKDFLCIERRGEQWRIFLNGCGVQNRLYNDHKAMEYIVEKISEHHAMEDWVYRHSLQFRWLRFWYRRKKRREARLQQRGTIGS